MLRNFLSAFVGSIPKIMPLFSNLKAFIFSDGKFRLDRSIVLLCALVIMIVGLNYISANELEVIIESLDEVSDILGYG